MNRKRLASQKDTRPDKGLKELEELLNTFDGLHVVEAEDWEGKGGELAYIWLEAKRSEDLFPFAQRLAEAMARALKMAEWLSPLYYVDLSIEWTCEKDRCFICLHFSPFPDKIRKIKEQFHDVRIQFFLCNKGIPQ